MFYDNVSECHGYLLAWQGFLGFVCTKLGRGETELCRDENLCVPASGNGIHKFLRACVSLIFTTSS